MPVAAGEGADRPDLATPWGLDFPSIIASEAAMERYGTRPSPLYAWKTGEQSRCG